MANCQIVRLLRGWDFCRFLARTAMTVHLKLLNQEKMLRPHKMYELLGDLEEKIFEMA